MKKPQTSTGRSLAKKASAKKASAKKAGAKKAGAKQAGAKKASAKKASAKKASGARASKKVAPRPSPVAARRADYGAPIEGAFARQPEHLRAILVALRALVEEVAPTATASLKWGMPFFSLDGVMMCALGAHKAHVNLILAGPPGTFDDPDGLLSGDGKTGRRLVLKSLDDLPLDRARAWLESARELARSKA